MLIDAAATVLVVSAAFLVGGYSAHQNHMVEFKLSGGVAMSQGELICLIQENNIIVYWAGPLDGHKYTINTNDPGEAILTYVPETAETLINPRGLVVETYAVASDADAELGFGSMRAGITTTEIMEGGNVLTYNSMRMEKASILIKNSTIAISIFDSLNSDAIGIAKTPGRIRLVA